MPHFLTWPLLSNREKPASIILLYIQFLVSFKCLDEAGLTEKQHKSKAGIHSCPQQIQTPLAKLLAPPFSAHSAHMLEWLLDSPSCTGLLASSSPTPFTYFYHIVKYTCWPCELLCVLVSAWNNLMDKLILYTTIPRCTPSFPRLLFIPNPAFKS